MWSDRIVPNILADDSSLSVLTTDSLPHCNTCRPDSIRIDSTIILWKTSFRRLQPDDWLLYQMEDVEPACEYQVGKKPGIVENQPVVKVEQPQGVIPARRPRSE